MARKGIIDLSLASSIPTFSGTSDENVEYFVGQVRDVAALENWPVNKRILILKLNCRDAAQKFLIDSPQVANIQNFDELAELLIEKFKRCQPFDEIQSKFNNIRQKPNQSIQSLIDEINSYAVKYLSKIDVQTRDSNEFIDSIKLNKILDAVRPEIKVEILKLGPKNYSEACKHARNVEKALEAQEVIINNNMCQNFELNSIMQSQLEGNKKIQELKEELERVKSENSASKSFRQTRNERVQCHICGKSHLTTKCWYFPQGRNSRNNNFNQNPNHIPISRGNSGGRNFGNYRNNRRNHPYRRRNHLNL